VTVRCACFISIATILAALLLYGCAGIEGILKPGPERDTEITAAIKPRRQREFAQIQRHYDLESLLISILQYNNLALSFDYFPQFAWNGDFVFPEYLHKIFRVENSPFRPGEGTVLIAGYEGFETELRIERALLRREIGSEWWQVRQTYFDDTIHYEVFVSEDGDPVRIRYIEPGSGIPHEVEPGGIGEYDGMQEGHSEERELLLEEEEAAEIAKEWSYAFNEPSIVGEELIEVAAGKFIAVHVRDTYDDEYGTIVDYWISPDVPGNIVKIVYSSPGLDSYIVELQVLTVGNTSVIEISEIVEGAGDPDGVEG